MALGNAGDIVSYTSPRDSSTHYGVVLGHSDDTHARVARNLGVKSGMQLSWEAEELVTAVTVLSGTDALHG